MRSVQTHWPLTQVPPECPPRIQCRGHAAGPPTEEHVTYDSGLTSDSKQREMIGLRFSLFRNAESVCEHNQLVLVFFFFTFKEISA